MKPFFGRVQKKIPPYINIYIYISETPSLQLMLRYKHNALCDVHILCEFVYTVCSRVSVCCVVIPTCICSSLYPRPGHPSFWARASASQVTPLLYMCLSWHMRAWCNPACASLLCECMYIYICVCVYVGGNGSITISPPSYPECVCT